jgi:acetylornithine deacetylase
MGIKEVIVCEPTKRVAGIAHRGVLSQRATLTGPGGHSSMADHLPKPIARLARLATALDDSAMRRVNDGPPGMTGTCMNIASLSGGIAFNVIAARAELEWSLRPYPGFDRADWTRELARIAEGITVETMIDHPPFAARPEATLVKAVAPFADSVGPLHFWTEAALYAEHGIDAVVIGPGDIAQAHAADEWVTLEDLDWAVEMLRAAM